MKESLDIIIAKVVFKYLKQFNKMRLNERQNIINSGEKVFIEQWLKIYVEEIK